MNNANSLLLLDDQAGTWTVQGGTIIGGTVRTAAAARIYIPPGGNMTLNGVRLDADLSLESSQLKIANGLSLSGRQIFGNGQITFTGTNAQTLRSGTVGMFDSTGNVIQNQSAAVARLGSDLVVRAE